MKMLIILVFSFCGHAKTYQQTYYDAGVPVIDLERLVSEDKTVWQAEEALFLKALEDVGFFVLTNHGISKDVMDVSWNMVAEFFDTDLENKHSVHMSEDYIYGYTAAEVLARSEDVGGADFEPDAKESLSIPIGSVNGSHGDLTRWPSRPVSMAEVLTEYYREVELVMARVLQCVARALKIDDNFFEDKNDDHLSVLRILNYPQQEVAPKPGVLRCSPHTDYGTFTILRQDSTGGLQVEKEENSGEWVDVKTEFYDFSVNIGDLFRRWTNDRFRSTRHRVVNPPIDGNQNRRQSVVYFGNINADAIVETLPTCLDETGGSKYPPITFSDFLSAKHHATQIYNEDGKSEL